MAAIKIISTPPGEAPLHIREAWVGLVLPLAVPSVRSVWIVGGVLTGPKTALGQWIQLLLGRGRRHAGYVVNIAAAVTLLERANPSAAAWWRENTPELMAENRTFVFSAEACEETEEVVWPPPPEPQAHKG